MRKLPAQPRQGADAAVPPPRLQQTQTDQEKLKANQRRAIWDAKLLAIPNPHHAATRKREELPAPQQQGANATVLPQQLQPVRPAWQRRETTQQRLTMQSLQISRWLEYNRRRADKIAARRQREAEIAVWQRQEALPAEPRMDAEAAALPRQTTVADQKWQQPASRFHLYVM